MFMVALPPAEPPARVVAGVQVTWPLSKPETSVLPGSKLTVRIVSKRRRAQVSLVRVDAAGRPVRAIARRTLKRGSFTVTVPAAMGARYALRLNVAGRKRFSWLTTPAPSPPAPMPVPAPTPTPVPLCAPDSTQRSEDINATVAVASASVAAGQALDYTVGNAGPGRLAATGSASLVPDGEPGPQFGEWSSPLTDLAVGASAQRSTSVSAGTAPGTYRLSAIVMWVSCDTVNTTRFLSAPFEVLPG
jgi:hypothetical protein